MGWFRRGRDDEELKQVAIRIATNLQRVRSIHFRRCVQRLEQLPNEERTERVRVVNRSLGTNTELAMAAFQLRHLNADSLAAFSRSDLRRLLGFVQTRVVVRQLPAPFVEIAVVREGVGAGSASYHAWRL